MTMDGDEITDNFRQRVLELMGRLPTDKVTTYGDIAAIAGSPRAARIVGGIAHSGPDDLPWHRLVNASGGLASGYPGGRSVQRQLLAQDGIVCSENDQIVNFEETRWRPEFH